MLAQMIKDGDVRYVRGYGMIKREHGSLMVSCSSGRYDRKLESASNVRLNDSSNKYCSSQL